MAQSRALIDTLKRALKSHGLTYLQVARQLDLSEASVKRMFSRHSFTLARLEAICQLMDMEITDLLRLYEEGQRRISRLTLEQEKQLVADPKLLLAAVCVRDNFSFEDITRRFDISRAECFSQLVHLDRLGLIALLPNNRIKLLVAPDFRWLPDGPIERFFEKRVQSEFLSSRFGSEGELRLYLDGSLSPGSCELLQRKMKSLAREFTELHHEDMALPLNERRHFGLLLAIRPWEMSMFASLKRGGREGKESGK